MNLNEKLEAVWSVKKFWVFVFFSGFTRSMTTSDNSQPMKKLGSSLDLEELSRSTSLNDINIEAHKSITKSKARKWGVAIGLCCLCTLTLIIILVIVLVTTQGTSTVYNWVVSKRISFEIGRNRKILKS